jgi:hypothetical protein
MMRPIGKRHVRSAAQAGAGRENAGHPAEDGSAEPPRPNARRLEFAFGALLAVAVFAVHLALEHRFDQLGIFQRYNILFGADPQLRLESLGRNATGFRFSHPALHEIFVLPIKGLSRLIAFVTPGALTAGAVERPLALLVAPTVAALQCWVVLRLFRRLGFAFSVAFLFALLDAVSMSGIVFGSMPETFCASSLAIALAYMLFLRTRARQGAPIHAAWFALEAVASGITITNIIPVGALHLLREIHAGGSRVGSVLRVAVLAGLAVATAVGMGWGASRLMRTEREPAPLFAEWVRRYVIETPAAHLATFPTAIVNTIVPPIPLRVRAFVETRRAPFGTSGPDALPPTPARNQRGPAGVGAPGGRRLEGVVVPFRMTFEHSRVAASPRNIAGILVVAALVWAAFTRRRRNPLLGSLARASLAILAFNWVFHSFWGDESFMYSMHWQVPLIVLIAALTAALPGRPRVVMPALGCVVAAVLVRNVLVVREMLSWFQGR